MFNKRRGSEKQYKLPGKRSQQLLSQLQQASSACTLGKGSYSELVALPENTDVKEWLAINLVHFIETISSLYWPISEYCTPYECPILTAGTTKKFEFLWQDQKNYPKPTKLSAFQYVERLFEWIDEQMDDEKIFPRQEGQQFPENFHAVVSNIYKRLYRVMAHMYEAHFAQVKQLELAKHLNSTFKHFLYFAKQYELVKSAEIEPTKELNEQMLGAVSQ